MSLIQTARRAAVILAALVGLAASSSVVSDDGFTNRVSGGGRCLLQTKNDCPISFEDKNYTIITSKCKGPQYPINQCCGALKEFACPYASLLNGPNNCADLMFDYIRLIGGYPPSLFSRMCRDNKQGLDCSSFTAPTPSQSDSNSGNTNKNLLSIIFLTYGFALGFLFS